MAEPDSFLAKPAVAGEYCLPSMSQRIPLNPCDYLYYAHHRLMRQSCPGGNIASMTVETEGHAEPQRVRRDLSRAMAAHPVTMSKLQTSLVFAWPYWAAPYSPERTADEVALKTHVYDDLRRDADGVARADRLCLERSNLDWRLGAEPQIRLEQYALPDGRTRFCIRWPHLLMDAEGALCFLSEIARAGEGDLPPELASDYRVVDVLGGCSLLERLRLFRKGLGVQGRHRDRQIQQLVQPMANAGATNRLIHRSWGVSEIERMQSNARRLAPAGSALYARYLAGCVIRAARQVYQERGVESSGYLIPMPMSVLTPSTPGGQPRSRPVPGNYLVSPLLFATREEAAERSRLGQALLDQLTVHHRDRLNLAQWTLMWAASFMRSWMYEYVVRLPLGFESMTSGFSYFSALSRPLREFAGLRVINLWGTGPIATPPGWNPVFCRFQDKLNLGMTYSHPAVSDDLAHRFALLIEQEMLEPD